MYLGTVLCCLVPGIGPSTGLVWYSMVQCGTVGYGVVRCGTVWYGLVWSGTVWLVRLTLRTMGEIRDKPQKEGETPLLAKLSNSQTIASQLFLTSLFGRI